MSLRRITSSYIVDDTNISYISLYENVHGKGKGMEIHLKKGEKKWIHLHDLSADAIDRILQKLEVE